MEKHVSKKKKWKVGRIVIILILLVLVGLGIAIGCFISGKLANLNIQEIDTSDLAVNGDLYNSVSDTLTENEFKDVMCIALFGTDSRDTGNMSSGRSDTIIIAAINTKFKTVKLISIPRDTYVEVPRTWKN